MDQIKIGNFISQLRHEKGWTQQQLADLLFVTNKTISRWETGVYMPDVEMLQLLSKTFDVGINELLAGKRLSGDELRQVADQNIVDVAQTVHNESAFTIRERQKYFKNKWKREHVALFVIMALIFVAWIVLPIVFQSYWWLCFLPIVGVAEYLFAYNKMMAYVETQLYDKILQKNK